MGKETGSSQETSDERRSTKRKADAREKGCHRSDGVIGGYEEDEEDIFKPKRTSSKKRSTSDSRGKISKVVPKYVSEKSHRTSKNIGEPKHTDSEQSSTQSAKGNTKKDSASNADTTAAPAVCNESSNINNTNQFCPICQVPLFILKISAEMHTSSCNVAGNLPDCPDGRQCESDNIFHYRDFAHHELAAFRDSEHYVPSQTQTPRKLTQSTSRKRSSVKKKTIPVKQRPSAETTSSFDHRKYVEELEDDPVLCTKKRLFSEETQNESAGKNKVVETSFELTSKHNDKPETPPLKAEFLWPNEIPMKTEKDSLDIEDDQEQKPLDPELLHTELNLKNEPNLSDIESTNIADDCFGNSLPSQQVSVSFALNYDLTFDSSEQVINRNKIKCSDKCDQQVDMNSINAYCSLAITSRGIKAGTAAVQSPVTLNLFVNNSGWEALEIKGKHSASVKGIDISLCDCAKHLDIGCNVADPSLKTDTSDFGQEDKFFSTFTDLGLKDPGLMVQPFRRDFLEQRTQLAETAHTISVSSHCQRKELDNLSAGNAVSAGILQIDSVDSEEGPDQPNVLSDPPTSVMPSVNLDGCRPGTPSSCDESRPPTPSSLSTHKSSAYAPVSMVASKSSPSSWTLHPALKTERKTAMHLNGQSSGGRRVPTYKRIPDTQFVVDAFNYGIIPGIKIYFLSHFHADHYGGLNRHFNKPIFCSQITANLVHLKIGVSNDYLHVLKIGQPRTVLGVEVEIFDANHCPGAVMFLFRLVDGRSFLHVGDFRAHESMEQFTQFCRVDKLFLDTTYCDPAYDFPSQEIVVDKVIETVRLHVNQYPSTLVVCGTYTIGKERVFLEIANAFGWRIWARSDKRKVLLCLEDEKLKSRLTIDPLEAQIHVLAMKDMNLVTLEECLMNHSCKYTHIVGFKPTGWTTSTSLKGKRTDFQRFGRGNVTVYGVPYSEHSSFSELRRFVRFVRPSDIQVTVNLTKTNQYKKMFEQWLSSSSNMNGQSSMMKFLTAGKS